MRTQWGNSNNSNLCSSSSGLWGPPHLTRCSFKSKMLFLMFLSVSLSALNGYTHSHTHTHCGRGDGTCVGCRPASDWSTRVDLSEWQRLFNERHWDLGHGPYRPYILLFPQPPLLLCPSSRGRGFVVRSGTSGEITACSLK